MRMRSMIDTYRCILENERKLKESNDKFVDAIGKYFEDECGIGKVLVKLYTNHIMINTYQKKISSDVVIKIITYFKDFDITVEASNGFILILLVMD